MDENTMLENGRLNIMIVDDEIITVQGILSGVDWKKLNFEHVFSCTDTDEVKELFQKYSIDILVSDIEMPDCSGVDLLKWVRQEGYDVECIFLTCHDKFSFAQEAVRLRCMNYVLKPIPYDQLTRLLMEVKEYVLEKKRLVRYQEWGKDTIQGMKSEDYKNEDNKKEIVNRIKQYIHEHLNEDLSIEILAGQVFLSADYVCRVFKKEEKMTVIEYITEERLFCAAELLQNSNISVAKAAISVGYNNYSYFSKSFKKKYKITPSEYQRIHGKRE